MKLSIFRSHSSVNQIVTNCLVSIRFLLALKVLFQNKVIVILKFLQFHIQVLLVVMVFELVQFFSESIRTVFKYFTESYQLLFMKLSWLGLRMTGLGSEIKKALCMCTIGFMTCQTNHVICLVYPRWVWLVKYTGFRIQSCH